MGLPEVWLAGLCAVGVIGLFLLKSARPLLWWLIGGAVFAVLFVLDSSSEAPWVRAVTQPWWNDSWRLDAIGAMGSVVLAAVGLVTIGRLLSRIAPRLTSLAATTLVALLVIIATKGLYVNRNTERLAQAFSDGPVVSHTMEAGMQELARLAPAGSLVMNDPVDGSPWMWSLAGAHPVFGHALILPGDAVPAGQQRMLLFKRFNMLDTDRAVQAAVRDLHIRYVFVSQGQIVGAKPSPIPGLRGLDQVRSLTPVWRNSQTAVYAVSSQIVDG
jgi:hypothetical protein